MNRGNPHAIPPQPKPGQPWGRPKGVPNKRTVEQREFAQKVMEGGKGAAGMEEFVLEVRRQFMAGILPANITALILYYFLGKPVERIEVKDKTPQMAPLDPQEIRDRALGLAGAIAQKLSEDTPLESPAESGSDSDGSIH